MSAHPRAAPRLVADNSKGERSMGTSRVRQIHSTRAFDAFGGWTPTAAWLIALLAGCATSIAELPPPGATPAPRPDRTVEIQLLFGAEADLDLFVTDPDYEEVYFANSPSRLGGELDADRRCEDPAPRTETVRFDPAPAGRYRVTVDFPRRCQAGVERVPYRVVVDVGSERQEVEDVLDFGTTEHVVLEFDVP